MAANKNQHYVPKVHLKQFSTDERKKQISIWLPKHDKIIVKASINDQCSKAYFYGQDLDVENFFNSPEGAWGTVVSKLTQSQSPSKDDLELLLFLWLLQHIRTERAISDQLSLMELMREKITLGIEFHKATEIFLGEAMGIPEAMKMALESAEKFYNSISDLRSVLLVNNTKTGFIMSDNPAVSSNKLIQKRFKHHRNWGLSSAGAYVYVPLTPNIALLAYDKHVYELNGRKGLTCCINENDARCLNQLVYIFSQNVVVLPPKSNHMAIVNNLKLAAEFKPSSTMRVNVAVKDEIQNVDGSVRFSVASDDSFAKSTEGLIHIENVPPRFPFHLRKLRIRQSPKFVDTNTGAGLKRFGRNLPFGN